MFSTSERTCRSSISHTLGASGTSTASSATSIERSSTCGTSATLPSGSMPSSATTALKPVTASWPGCGRR
eukprot:323039-Alexandrium_andersonii.AAC.1